MIHGDVRYRSESPFDPAPAALLPAVVGPATGVGGCRCSHPATRPTTTGRGWPVRLTIRRRSPGRPIRPPHWVVRPTSSVSTRPCRGRPPRPYESDGVGMARLAAPDLDPELDGAGSRSVGRTTGFPGRPPRAGVGSDTDVLHRSAGARQDRQGLRRPRHRARPVQPGGRPRAGCRLRPLRRRATGARRARHARLRSRAGRGVRRRASPSRASTSSTSASSRPTSCTSPPARSTRPGRCSPPRTTRRSTTA